ncbi:MULTISPECIES: hypothetical protein [unclassified Pseudomonas]|uniref:hypothetical protein n=1 Tax=unclassified Pseudomonas TaxID=196821 RepID=UPI001F57D1DA|nr:MULTISPECIES: hypothetical protein [unclassified Pseudomonas]
MKLMEWTILKNLYKLSRKRPNKLLFKRGNARKLWPMWLAAASTIPLCIFAGFGIKYPGLTLYAYIALAPWAFILYFTRLKALRTVYPQQFSDHAIDHQSWMEKENILCYAFFLETVREEGYTTQKLRELSAYSDLTCKPPRPPLSQNLIFASLIAFMIALSTEVIKATPFFTLGKGSIVLILGSVVLFCVWLVLDGVQSTAYERVRIKRYLDLAAYDLDDAAKNIPSVNPDIDSFDTRVSLTSSQRLDSEIVRVPVRETT